MKTIFTRFCQVDGQIPAMTARVAAANHLGHLLVDGKPRADVARSLRRDQGSSPTGGPAGRRPGLTDPVAAANPPRELTEFQNGFYEMARLLRHAGLPGGHP